MVKKKNKNGKIVFIILLVVIAGMFISQQFSLVGIEETRLSAKPQTTYNIGGNSFYINRLDFIGGCEQGLGTSADDEWERTPDNGRHIWHKYIPFEVNGERFIYETSIWSGCYNIPPISTSADSIHWLSGYHIEKKKDGVLVEFDDYIITMGQSRVSTGGRISKLSEVRSGSCDNHYGAGATWNSLKKTCDGVYVLNVDVKDKKRPFTINAPTVLFTNQNFDIPIEFDSFHLGKGFVDVTYSYEDSIFQDVSFSYDFDFKKGMNTFKIPVPTQTEAKLQATYRIGIYLDLDIKYSPYITEAQTIVLLINPRPLWLEKTTCGDNCVGCPGYIVGANKEYCVDNEVQDISCAQIGCPVLEGHDYQCMSSGYCSEFVQVFIDRKINESQCNEICEPKGGVCQLSENQDWYCIEEKIVEIIKELPTPVYISKTCEDFDVCDTSAGYKCIDIEVEGEPQATCERTVTEIKIDENLYTIAIIILVIAVITSGVIVFRRKKRRKK